MKTCNSEADYKFLDEIALRSGTDKASTCHNYMDVYAQFFAPLREKPIKFLEIGLYEGSSVKLWEEYFPKADLHFYDLTFHHLKYHSQRSHYHLGNQESREDLQKLIDTSGGAFDVIIDDGGHTANQQLTSFYMLFPHLKSGGHYIIEDLHSSYWWGIGPGSTIHFLKNLVDEVNYVGARTGKASHLDLPASILSELNLYRQQIRSLTFFTSIVVITKR